MCEVSQRIKHVRSLVFSTAKVKTALLRTLKHVKQHGYWKDAKGVTEWLVKGQDGVWHAPGSIGFDAACAFQAARWGRR